MMLRTIAFSEDEKRVVSQARAILHIDKPVFYHDAILTVALQIIKDYEDGQKKVANN